MPVSAMPARDYVARQTRAATSAAGMTLIAILVLACALRAAGLNAESFTMDEVTDLRIAALPAFAIVPMADGFPPLYHLLLKGWLLLWTTPLAVRWLSALLGVVTVFAVYRLAIETAGPRAAIVAAVLTAVSPLHVWFAQESRAYALALPLAALMLWRFVRALATGTRRDWLIYAGVTVAAVCTHYYLAIVAAVQAFWVLPRLLRPSVDRGPVLTAYTLLALAALPVLGLLRADLGFQAGTGAGHIGLGEVLYTPYTFLIGFSAGPSLRELHDAGLESAVLEGMAWVAALAACLAPIALTLVRRPRPHVRGVGHLLAVALVPPAVTLGVAALLGMKYKVSYVAWASIPLFVLIGAIVAHGWSRWSVRAAAAGYLVLALAALGNRHFVERYRNEDVRALAAYLERQTTREPVLVLAGYMAEPLSFYLGPTWSVRPLPTGSPALRSLADLAATNTPAWIVYTRPFHGDPDGEVRAGLSTSPRSISARRSRA
jgi:hypothetical protein